MSAHGCTCQTRSTLTIPYLHQLVPILSYTVFYTYAIRLYAALSRSYFDTNSFTTASMSPRSIAS